MLINPFTGTGIVQMGCSAWLVHLHLHLQCSMYVLV